MTLKPQTEDDVDVPSRGQRVPPMTPRIGELLVRNGDLSQQMLDVALREQKRTRRPLGEILVDNGVPMGSLVTALLKQARAEMSKGRLGELLVQNGLATPKQIGEALHQTKVQKKPLGEILVTSKIITQAQLKAILLYQQRQDELDDRAAGKKA
jgi:bacteriophage N4 adsorption protein B